MYLCLFLIGRKESFFMEFYETTLKGMKKLLSDFNEDKYAEIVESCLIVSSYALQVSLHLARFSVRSSSAFFRKEHRGI